MKKKSTQESVEVANIIEAESNVQVSQSPQSLIAMAIKGKAPLETIEKLMDLQDRWDAKQAKIAFDEDMARLQGELPVIEKRKSAKNDSGKVLYMYAPLDDIISQVGQIISKHNFSYSFRTVNTSDKVSVTCITTHRLGHSTESIMETGLSTKTGIMSVPQQIAATLTFNKRYSFCNSFGIMTGDEDKEEAVSALEPKKEAFVNYINKLKVALNKQGAMTEQEAVEVFNIITGESITQLPISQSEAQLLFNELLNSPLYENL